jgi:hypothetical protein
MAFTAHTFNIDELKSGEVPDKPELSGPQLHANIKKI